jgi:uncharacterized protein YyaL (SSP411 family)
MNRLKTALSPYLLEHSDNPVDWYSLEDNPFEMAQDKDLPVFVSIGYSACHWCHVMASESFEDPATAELLNNYFINVKVDKEEHPDIDAYFMEAAFAINGTGGWPLSIFCTPDKKPFFAGTYFPKKRTVNMVSFTDVIEAIHDVWQNDRTTVIEQANRLTEAINERISFENTLKINVSQDLSGITNADETAIKQLLKLYDQNRGGFSNAPKFYHFPKLELSFMLLSETDNALLDKLKQNYILTLDAYCAGGVRDHVAGGFFRYSTDGDFTIPHFEKMLYDQAMILISLTHAFSLTKLNHYKKAAYETAEFVMSQMTSESGGYISSIDADTLGVEGMTYVWDKDDILNATGDSELTEYACNYFNVTSQGNFEKKNVLKANIDRLYVQDANLDKIKAALKHAQLSRPQPKKDAKIVLEYNAMMISALLEASFIFEVDEWKNHAKKSLDFLLNNLVDQNGIFRRAYRDCILSSQPAGCIDISWLIYGLIKATSVFGSKEYLFKAKELTDYLIEHFYDEKNGDFFANEKSALLPVRAKDKAENLTFSGNGLSAINLLYLGSIFTDEKYYSIGQSLIENSWELVSNHPAAFCSTIIAAKIFSKGVLELIIPGNETAYKEAAKKHPSYRLLMLPLKDDTLDIFLQKSDGLAYLCTNGTCKKPAADPNELELQLGYEIKHLNA